MYVHVHCMNKYTNHSALYYPIQYNSAQEDVFHPLVFSTLVYLHQVHSIHIHVHVNPILQRSTDVYVHVQTNIHVHCIMNIYMYNYICK